MQGHPLDSDVDYLCYDKYRYEELYPITECHVGRTALAINSDNLILIPRLDD
jgi:hypothetical protein